MAEIVIQDSLDAHATFLHEMGTYGTTNDVVPNLHKRKRDDSAFQILLLDDGITNYDHLFQEQPEMNYDDSNQQMNTVKHAHKWDATTFTDPAEAQHVCSPTDQQTGAPGAPAFELNFGDHPNSTHILNFSEAQPMQIIKRARNDPSGHAGHAVQQQQQQRRLWVKDRSKLWWESCNHPDFPESEFKKVFRMSTATFDMICEKLDLAVKKKDTTLRLPIPVRQRVAVCIFRLATGEPLRRISTLFGLGISTCHKLVLEVCTAIRSVLVPMFLNWPSGEKLAEIKHDFESFSKISNVAGAIYTTHVPIIAPKTNPAMYLSKHRTQRGKKNSYSVTLQGVFDSRGVFTDISIGRPGSLPDDQVLEKSPLYMINKTNPKQNMWVVGNSSYPLTDWLLTPYTHQNLTWAQDVFNDKLAEIQTVAKSSFARLKGRWACLQSRMEMKLQDLPVMIVACCVLHNICEMTGEEMHPKLKVKVFDYEMLPNNAVWSVRSARARDHIAHDLLHHVPQIMRGVDG